MNTKLMAGGALAGLVLTTGIAGMVSAQSAAATTGLTAEQVIEIALMEVPGEVQEVERDTEDGIQIFEVEILGADGVETEIEIAAETGEVLSVEVEEDKDCDDDRDEEDDDDEGEDA